MKILNFHTHHPTNSSELREIVSFHLNETVTDNFHTIGAHPWWTKTELSDSKIELLRSKLSHENCLALGEIGLDKLKGTRMEIQIKNLRKQLEVAEELNLPVIIHCVKAFDQLLAFKKEFSKIENWCIHGFNKKVELAKQLLSAGFYFSLPISSNFEALLQELPSEKVFFETDDSIENSIDDIYSKASTTLNKPVIDLTKEHWDNAEDFFGKNSIKT